ncbi:hypothetical protein TR51_04400 [Kitasatospora griseola]|uniref:Uncharacterized protein n=1 Tax=Kitasatospora griseola TaxID=2064 RepID=A0A0D0Q6L6_KITGR|nr:hypothetical protein [Kitasatospora griseola]KIQ66728.1 hypothetical protein TR51_04400 [Kitasatospora griseola]
MSIPGFTADVVTRRGSGGYRTGYGAQAQEKPGMVPQAGAVQRTSTLDKELVCARRCDNRCRPFCRNPLSEGCDVCYSPCFDGCMGFDDVARF